MTKIVGSNLTVSKTPLFEVLEFRVTGVAGIEIGDDYFTSVKDAPDLSACFIAGKHLESIKTGEILAVRIFKKIPGDLIAECRKILQVIYDEKRTEGAVIITYDKNTEEFAVFVPKQTVSGASVDLEVEDVDEAFGGGEKLIAASFHSHPFGGSGGGFLSHTDHSHADCIPGVPIASFNFSTSPISGNVYKFGSLKCTFHNIPMDTMDLVEDVPEIVEINQEERAAIKEKVMPRIKNNYAARFPHARAYNNDEYDPLDTWESRSAHMFHTETPERHHVCKGFVGSTANKTRHTAVDNKPKVSSGSERRMILPHSAGENKSAADRARKIILPESRQTAYSAKKKEYRPAAEKSEKNSLDWLEELQEDLGLGETLEGNICNESISKIVRNWSSIGALREELSRDARELFGVKTPVFPGDSVDIFSTIESCIEELADMGENCWESLGPEGTDLPGTRHTQFSALRDKNHILTIADTLDCLLDAVMLDLTSLISYVMKQPLKSEVFKHSALTEFVNTAVAAIGYRNLHALLGIRNEAEMRSWSHPELAARMGDAMVGAAADVSHIEYLEAILGLTEEVGDSGTVLDLNSEKKATVDDTHEEAASDSSNEKKDEVTNTSQAPMAVRGVI